MSENWTRRASGASAGLRGTKTIVLSSYKRDGTPVATPVSLALEGDRFFFRSYDRAWKTRRIRNNPRVEVAPSTLRGKPTGEPVSARAVLLEDEQAKTAARALARRHRVLQRFLVPVAHQVGAPPDDALRTVPRRGGSSVAEMTISQDDLLAELRPVSFAIAYRMLGSVADAEDVVQEASLRVLKALKDGVQIESPEAYVATVTTRLAIDELRSARVRREQYVGEWIPEPLLHEPTGDDPASHAEMADSLSLALLVILERLSPEQRAVFLLHDVFDYGYREIAEVVGRREDSVRQLAARARRYVHERRPRFDSSPSERAELARRFFAAAGNGEVGALEALLAQDVVLHGDGGGRVPALARAIAGRQRVAQTLVVWSRALARVANGQLRPAEVNGQPGALLLDADGGLLGVWSLDIADQHVQTVRSIVNPDKLRHLGQLSALTSHNLTPRRSSA